MLTIQYYDKKLQYIDCDFLSGIFCGCGQQVFAHQRPEMQARTGLTRLNLLVNNQQGNEVVINYKYFSL